MVSWYLLAHVIPDHAWDLPHVPRKTINFSIKSSKNYFFFRIIFHFILTLVFGVEFQLWISAPNLPTTSSKKKKAPSYKFQIKCTPLLCKKFDQTQLQLHKFQIMEKLESMAKCLLFFVCS